MMIFKISTNIILLLLLSACDHLGTTRVKSLIHLTADLSVDSSEPINNLGGKSNTIISQIDNQLKTKSYKISHNNIISKPAIAKNIIYSLDNRGYVHAFSLKNHQIIWKSDISNYKLNRNFNAGGILFSDNKLYITNGSRDLIILNASNGNEILRKEFVDILRTKPIMVSEKLMILKTINNHLIAYDIKSLKILWTHQGGISVISHTNDAYPISYNNNVIASYSSGEIVSLDKATGKLQWMYNLSNTDHTITDPNFVSSTVITTPIVNKNYAYFATSNGKLIKIDLDNGGLVWSKMLEDVQSIKLINKNLLITNNARKAAIVSTHDGKIKWIGDLISTKDKLHKTPKTNIFHTAFVIKNNNKSIINIIAFNGELYQFDYINGVLSSTPRIISIPKKVKYHWISCCSGKVYFITNRYIYF